MLSLIAINQIYFQTINKLHKQKLLDKESFYWDSERYGGVWKTLVAKYTLDNEVMGKVLSELKNLKC
jgi:hypothetical protein